MEISLSQKIENEVENDLNGSKSKKSLKSKQTISMVISMMKYVLNGTIRL